jgi:hypothetical protein
VVISIIFIQNVLDTKTRVVFCNVGEGSAVYIRVHNKVDVLINTGLNKKILNCLSTHMPFFDRSIEYIFITSPSQKYSQGLVSLLNRYSIGTIYLPKIFLESKNGKIVDDFIKTNNTRLKNISDVRSVHIMNALLNIVQLQTYLGIHYREESYEAILLGTIPGRILSKFSLEYATFPVQNLYLLQLPVYGFNTNPKYDILSLAEAFHTVINRQSSSISLEKLQTLTSHLRALNKNYAVSNDKEDVVFTLN